MSGNSIYFSLASLITTMLQICRVVSELITGWYFSVTLIYYRSFE
jgi:hypothetical protein